MPPGEFVSRHAGVVPLHASAQVEPTWQTGPDQGRPVRLRPWWPLTRIHFRQNFRGRATPWRAHLRIFCYLTTRGGRSTNLSPAVEQLLRLAEKTTRSCISRMRTSAYVASFKTLDAVVTAFRHPRLRALPDIANALRGGLSADGGRTERTAALFRHSPLQDSSKTAGAIRRPWRRRYTLPRLLAPALASHPSPLTFTVETLRAERARGPRLAARFMGCDAVFAALPSIEAACTPCAHDRSHGPVPVDARECGR